MTAPIPAACILLLRDDDGTARSLQVFMVVRPPTMGAFSNALVFPGGKLDAADRAGDLRPFCRNHHRYNDDQLAFRAAAIRELFEECGVLLARPRAQQPAVVERLALLDHRQLATLQDQRQALNDGRLTLLELCRGHQLELATDRLTPFAHWVTPKIRPKIFDTHFFLAPTPPDQTAAHDGQENLDSMWLTPHEALRRGERGETTLVFPTWMKLRLLTQAATVAEALAQAAARRIVRVQPEVEASPAGNIMRIPFDAGYGASRVLVSKDGRSLRLL